MDKIILVGFGGHAISVADCIERDKQFHIAGYVDFTSNSSRYHYLGNDAMLEEYYRNGIKHAAVCVGYLGKGTVRERLYDKLKKIGYDLPVIADPSSIVSNSSSIGEGTFIGKNVVINAGSTIGKMCIINTSAVIEHQCTVGDYSHISVSCVLCGNVIVKKAAFIGANATVIQGQMIDAGEIVPAGKIIRHKGLLL